MPSTSTREVQVKAEVMVEAVAKARVDIDLNQKADHQATDPIVFQITLPRGAKYLVRNATIATKKAIFPSTVGPSSVDIPHPKQNLMVPDDHAVMYMTLTKVNLVMPLNLNKALLP